MLSLNPKPNCRLIALLAGLISLATARADSPTIPLPVIPSAVFNITNHGAVGDGKTLNTAAIQKTIAACSAAGGGTVVVPAGRFVFGPITLASSLNLHLDRGATLLISDDLTNYPASANRYQDCITVVSNTHDLEISGAGVIDGQGKAWWNAFRADKQSAKPAMAHRPYMFRLANCTRLRVTGVTLQNSPMFHLALPNCEDVTIRGITIQAPPFAPNTDGIDPSGWNYLIEDCVIDTGDDNIAIKPNGHRMPGNNHFLVRNCTFRHGHGMSIGGGSAGGLEDLTVSNCTFAGTDSGIRIKTGRGNSGLVQNLVYENLTMTDVKHPFYINDYYPERTAPKEPAGEKAEPVDAKTPINRNITIRNVTVTNCPGAGAIRGVPEMPIENITFSNVNVWAQSGLILNNAKGIRFIDSSIHVEDGEPLITYNAEVSGLK